MASIKEDKWILKMAKYHNMIEPFVSKQIRFVNNKKIISYGISSYGYDIRCNNQFKIFNKKIKIIDPKNCNEDDFINITSKICTIPANSFALAHTIEYFKIPRNILAICVGKSTYARCGIIINVTPLEPEWEGQITLEFSNTTSFPAKIYANEGVAQILFFQSKNNCITSYKDRKGKYQKQIGITLPKI